MAFPYNDAKLLSTITLRYDPKALFVEGRYLAVFGNFQKLTIVEIYNIENRANPTLIKNFAFTGSYKDGRKLLNGFIYLINVQPSDKIPMYTFGGERKIVDPSSIFKYPT